MAQHTQGSSQASDQVIGGGKRRIFWFGIVVVFAIVAGIFSVAFYTAQKAEQAFEDSSRAEMSLIASNRMNEFNKWLGTVQEQTSRFANSKIIVDFARDVDEMGGDISSGLGSEDTADINLLQSYLSNFVSYSSFDFGSMLNSRGEIYINTDPAYQSLNRRQRDVVAQVVAQGRPIYGPVRSVSERPLHMEFYVPVIAPAAQDEHRVVAVLYLTQTITQKMRELLLLEGYANQGYNATYLQRVEGKIENVDVKSGRVHEVSALTPAEDDSFNFAERASAVSGKSVYSQGVKLGGIDAWVLVELDYAQARSMLDIRINDYYKLSALGALVLVLLVSVVWRWFISLERSQTLSRFQELFAVIDEQKRLLDSINGTIAEPISLTDANGNYLYVNQAFAEVFGRVAENIVGLDTAAVCGFDTARRLGSSDQHVLMTGEKVTTSEIIWIKSKRHYFQISKAPLRDADSHNITGIVAVFRDVTKLVEAEERSHRMVQQTIDALVSVIEQADPFLGGHSRIMGEIAGLLCKGLNLSDKESATIETAATLSQIGKMFVPREVLTKPGALTPEEKKVMEQHVRHTLDALSKIEFDLPVLEAIAQMNERLDGKGYPYGLTAEDINIYGKVLAVANAFTAMARPRSYRPAMDVKTVLDTLEKQAGSSYDPHVLEVLRGVLDTPAGEKIVGKAAKSTPV